MQQTEVQLQRVRRAVETYAQGVVRFAFSYLRCLADAEDVAQEVFLAYMKKAPAFRDTAGERAWIFRVTANKCKNVLKSGWFKSRNPLPEELPAAPQDRDVLEAVLSLREKYRVPIHLYYYEDYSIREIAELLGASPATVGTWLARGREILRAQIGGIDDEV